jgi:hypothetical protein
LPACGYAVIVAFASRANATSHPCATRQSTILLNQHVLMRLLCQSHCIKTAAAEQLIAATRAALCCRCAQ